MGQDLEDKKIEVDKQSEGGESSSFGDGLGNLMTFPRGIYVIGGAVRFAAPDFPSSHLGPH